MSTSLENILYSTTTSGIDMYPQGTEALYIIFNNNPLQQPSVFDTGGMSGGNNNLRPMDYYDVNNENKPWSLTKWNDDFAAKPLEPLGYQYIHRPEMFDEPFKQPSIFEQPSVLSKPSPFMKAMDEPLDLGCGGYKIAKWQPDPIAPTYYGMPEQTKQRSFFDEPSVFIKPSPYIKPLCENLSLGYKDDFKFEPWKPEPFKPLDIGLPKIEPFKMPLFNPEPEPMINYGLGNIGKSNTSDFCLRSEPLDYLSGGCERFRKPHFDPLHGNHFNYELEIIGLRKNRLDNYHLNLDND